MNIYFILVSPQLAENVGAAARAMNTMGFDHLRLVTPCDHLCQRARWVAHASQHILEEASVYSSLAEAIIDLDFVIGTTTRRRGKRREYFAGAELPQLLESKGSAISKVGILFGREDRGLLNEEIEKCDALVALSMRAPYPSLNLAQAVMVFAYILSPFVLTMKKKKQSPPPANEFKSLKNRIFRLFMVSELDDNPNIVNRLLERMAHLSEEDIHMLHSVCARLERKIIPDNNVLQL
ncbi:tRNA/rRNA methyltransferase [candidate division KSB1 bacterium]|nr:tRNA/rRNA methyltransferase [candidate division KSB1 bacterium]RQW00154.1 MAG: tRNA/rRNA methyltransferase [candidate division KSB1 bacterium]